MIVADSVGDCKTFAIRERGICLHPHSGMNADEGVGSVQPDPSNSPLDWHGFAEAVISQSITLTKAQWENLWTFAILYLFIIVV